MFNNRLFIALALASGTPCLALSAAAPDVREARTVPADSWWVSESERKHLLRWETAIDFQPGEPETDATRFYLDAEKKTWLGVNYDETKSGEGTYALEDPLTFVDGRKVETPTDWAARRKEILGIFEREVYGRLPPKPESMVFDNLGARDSFGGRGISCEYRQWFRADRTGPSVTWLVIRPKAAKKPAPVILHMNYKGNAMVAEGRTNHFPIPIDEILRRGYALMTACYEDVASDPRGPKDVDRAYDGVFELWGRRDFAKTDNPGSIMAWAWGFMRGLDLAESIPALDATHATVIGSSRIGKAALVAGAFDERFKVVIPNQTGAAGVQLLKRNYGETPAIQYHSTPHWYCEGYWKWREDPRRQPFDQHLLLACVAPRALLLECYHKKWFDPKGEWLSARAASPVWKFLCGKTLGAETWPDPYSDVFTKPPFGYVRRRGTHGLASEDWKWALDFADRAIRQDRRTTVRSSTAQFAYE